MIQLPDGASLQRTDAVAKQVREILQKTPGVDIVGLDQRPQLPDQRRAIELGRRIRDPEAVGRARSRTASPRSIVAAVRPKLLHDSEAYRPEFRSAFDSGPRPRPAASSSRSRISTGRGSVALNDAAQAVIAEARKQPELSAQQLFTSFSTSTPQFTYDLDRNKAKLLGLNLPDVFNTLQIYLGSLYVNDFNLFGRTFRVTMQADKGARAAATDISRLYVRNATGGMVPLEHARPAAPDRRPETVPHYNNYASALINGGRGAGLQLGPGGGRDGARRRGGAAATISATNGPASRIQELKAGSIATRRVRPRDRLRLPDPGCAV